ncbi:hypothetical protein [Marivirga sp.]|uniref:hypothetical protein n=1 Tax=Marivirga sp. TaxID=2018662 RepID=UPI003DA73E03
MSIITVNGSIQVKDSNNSTHTIQGSDFDLDHVSTDNDRPMGPGLIYEATIENEDIEVTLMVSEYPAGGYETHDVTVHEGTLVSNNLKVSVQSE